MHQPMTTSEENLQRAAELLRSARSVAVFTGAGVSAESGVPTFRGSDGLWEGHRVEDVATPMAFRRDPGLVWKFYNLRRDNLRSVEPNPGHHALAEIERRWGDRFGLITQNVDGLHRAAGNERVYELHGSLRRVRCSIACGYQEECDLNPLDELPSCPKCGHLARPDIVWFGETLPEDQWEAAVGTVMDCDCLMVVGTSAVVYPAAGLIPMARDKEPTASVIEINLEPSAVSGVVDVGLYGPSGELLPKLVALL